LSDTFRLRYTGEQAATFQQPGVGYVEPQGEFDVPAEALLSFMRRRDIEHAGECPAPPCKCGEEPEPEASEEASASQEGETIGGRRSGGRARSGSPGGKSGTGEQKVP
jgi:hypothetical protein